MSIRKISVEERNMISNALGLQLASFKRAQNDAAKKNASDLIAYYDKQYQLCNRLLVDVNNLELFS